MIDRFITERARVTPNRVAIDAADRAWTYAELDARSDELAARLDPGSRVSTLTGNSAEHVSLLFACAKAAAILHPISWRLAPAEIAYQLDDAGPAVLLVEEEHRALAEAALELAARRPAAPDLHLGHDRQAEGRAAHACELLLDESLVRSRDRDHR